jgi:HAT1-interacting factor 1
MRYALECCRVRHFGELAPECATTYYKYGCALFDKLQDEADPLGETVNPNNAPPSSHGEGSSGKGDTRFLQSTLLDTPGSTNFTPVI